MSEIKATLPNQAQEEAIAHEGSPLLVIAGAGTGKTEMLTNKVIRTIQNGILPERILMMTFTNKAAQNMVKRIQKKTGAEVNICAGTFHGIAYRLINEIGFERGLYKGERILGGYQIQRIWEKSFQTVFEEGERGLLKQLGLGGIPRLRFWYSKVKTGGHTFATLVEAYPEIQNWNSFKPGCVTKVFDTYRQLKFDYKGMDFDDILLMFREMLQNKDMRKSVRARFDAFFVDEYQDTSVLQAEILQLLVGDNQNLTVVGDPNQSVYAFLSANVGNIIHFTKLFPTAKTIKLNLNYRSTQAVLDFANTILVGNKESIFNPLESAKGAGGHKPTVHKYGSDRSETLGVLRDIKALTDGGMPGHEIAILSRQSFTTFTLEAQLTKAGIPYVKYGGLKLTAKKNIRQFLAFLELAIDPYNWLAWETILPMVPMIGEELTIKLVADLSYSTKWDWKNPPPFSIGSGKRWHAFSQAWQQICQVDRLKDSKVETFLQDAYDIFVPIYENYIANASERELASLEAEDAVDASYMAKDDSNLTGYNQEGKSAANRPEAAVKLREIKDYIVTLELTRREDLQTFLNQFQLDDSKEVKVETEGKLIISTIHSAKGLEWQCVFLLGLEEGTLPPSKREYGVVKDAELQEIYPDIKPYLELPYIEEERRLFYVAVTRAMHTLHLCYSSQRMGRGLADSQFVKNFKPAGQPAGLQELTYNHWIYEKMRSDEENAQFRDKRLARATPGAEPAPAKEPAPASDPKALEDFAPSNSDGQMTLL